MSENPSTPDEAEVTMTGEAVSDGAYTLLVADFSDTTSAREAYEALKEVEDGRRVQIDGVIVVNRSTDGKLTIEKATDHTTRRGLKWGLVGGAALGLIFPPSILGSAAVLGAAGAAAGKVGQLRNRNELSRELESSVVPGHSAIVAVVSDPAVLELRKALDQADAIVESAVDRVVADELRAAAKEADDETPAVEAGSDASAGSDSDSGSGSGSDSGSQKA
ncbi:DUF1269 domain-containing protein [Humibacillus xanthopallidus]|uniref:Putative membrane protein n=1 Tax=Humibacillus xanthopallidus TaxID=412689 RepID=A0A543I0Z1_9MICO|nr:DUF1269 domain-containing protein [Humibacillus xanthopallidus]TQM64248.1 putative membrane protein [Humibacillus xanthopallidus]